MKAKIFDQIKTTVQLYADFSDMLIPPSTYGTIVECYSEPEGYAVDLSIPDETLVGGRRFENVILSPDQFVVVRSATSTSPEESL